MSYSPDVTVLTFTVDNPCNTTLTNPKGIELYRVVTETGEKNRTFVRDANGELIASSEWHLNTPDRIRWRDQPAVSIYDWMKKSLIPFNE